MGRVDRAPSAQPAIDLAKSGRWLEGSLDSGTIERWQTDAGEWTIVPSADELPTLLVLRAGEERAIDLPGLGTAGYAWDHELEGDTGAVEASWKRGRRVSSEHRPVGQSALEVLTLHALRPGHVKIRVAQRRPWERDTPPLRQHEIDIEVTK